MLGSGPLPGVKGLMRRTALLTAFAVCLALAATARGQTTPAASAPTHAEMRAAGWLPYAQSLVRGEQPVGVVLREHELHDAVATDATTTGTAGTSVVQTTRGVVTRLMSRRARRCQEALQRPVVPLVLRGRPLSVLFDLVMQDPEASAKSPPGIVGGGSAVRRSNERMGQRLELRVEFGDTLESALDRLVSTGLPFGWGVIEHDEPSASPCQIVLFTEDTVWWTSYDALLPVPSLP